eukprot:scaffold3030_cov164-Amphora_coffeaeformis.AAC.2
MCGGTAAGLLAMCVYECVCVCVCLRRVDDAGANCLKLYLKYICKLTLACNIMHQQDLALAKTLRPVLISAKKSAGWYVVSNLNLERRDAKKSRKANRRSRKNSCFLPFVLSGDYSPEIVEDRLDKHVTLFRLSPIVITETIVSKLPNRREHHIESRTRIAWVDYLPYTAPKDARAVVPCPKYSNARTARPRYHFDLETMCRRRRRRCGPFAGDRRVLDRRMVLPLMFETRERVADAYSAMSFVWYRDESSEWSIHWSARTSPLETVPDIATFQEFCVAVLLDFMLQGMHDAKDVRNFVPIVEGGIIGNTVAICGLITVAALVRSFGVVRAIGAAVITVVSTWTFSIGSFFIGIIFRRHVFNSRRCIPRDKRMTCG